MRVARPRDRFSPEATLGDHVAGFALPPAGAGGQVGWIHVGLGGADRAEVRVLWPDGETGPWQRVDAGTHVLIERGADAPRVTEATGR